MTGADLALFSRSGFTVRLLEAGSTNKWLPEVFFNDEAYFVGKPGQAFEVVVKDAEVVQAAKRHLIEIHVDGRSPGSMYLLSTGQIATFCGFVRWRPAALAANSSKDAVGKGQPTNYNAFTFGVPQLGKQVEVAADSKSPVGRLDVKVTLVTVTGSRPLAEATLNIPAVPASAHTADTKPTKVPSLVCQAGPPRARNDMWTNPTYERGEVLAHFTLRYETADTLVRRGVLDPANPAHAAVLGAGGWKPPKAIHDHKLPARLFGRLKQALGHKASCDEGDGGDVGKWGQQAFA